MHTVESFLQELASVLQIVKIYMASHPKSREAIERAHQRLDTLFEQYEEVTIGIVGGEFVFGSEIFFDLSNRLRELIVDFSSRGIEKMIFVKPVRKEELERFIAALSLKKTISEKIFRVIWQNSVLRISMWVKSLYRWDSKRMIPCIKKSRLWDTTIRWRLFPVLSPISSTVNMLMPVLPNWR